jgi:hypothetical protein
MNIFMCAFDGKMPYGRVVYQCIMLILQDIRCANVVFGMDYRVWELRE